MWWSKGWSNYKYALNWLLNCLTYAGKFLDNLQSGQFAGFIRISHIKIPSPMPETGSYDSSICSPFWLKFEPNTCKFLQPWHTSGNFVSAKNKGDGEGNTSTGEDMILQPGRVAAFRCGEPSGWWSHSYHPSRNCFSGVDYIGTPFNWRTSRTY